jgi:hypothetical protein
MLKNTTLALLVCLIITACGQTSSYEKAENALDGGRFFLENLNKGEIKKAKMYLLDNPENNQLFDSLSKDYLALDKEGRQLLRQASIQINEIQEKSKTESHILYQLSVDSKKRTLKVVSTPEGWKVDLKYSYQRNE